MRTEREADVFQETLMASGKPEAEAHYSRTCWESGIPRMFWGVTSDDITFNRSAFEGAVKPYLRRYATAHKHGYGLLLMGDNGTGKTTFISWILTQLVKRNLSVYYTTLAQLDIDIKRGFKDGEAERRLEHLLSSDWVAIDEVGKEHFRSDSYLNTRLELLLKQRYDDGEPVLLATNVDYGDLCEMYGPTVASMLEGKYQPIMLDPGDYRKSTASRMRSDMGFSGDGDV